MTVTNIEYIEEKLACEISFKIYTDDFENIINQNYGVNLNLGKENELPEYSEYVDKYINKNFKLTTNKKNPEQERPTSPRPAG